MNIQRLETLTNFLETFPKDQIEKKKFNLSGWMVSNKYATEYFEHKPTIKESDDPFSFIEEANDLDSPVVVEPNYCQTVGCAVGWATTIPEFKEAGLCLKAYSDQNLNEDQVEVTYKGHNGMNAAVAFFEFSDYNVAACLFAPLYYDKAQLTNPLVVAERIRRLIEVGEIQFIKEYRNATV